MKITSLLFMACLGAAASKPFATPNRVFPPIPVQNIIPVKRVPSHAVTTDTVLSVPRGGDLGPLTAETAAKTLVGFTIMNGYPMWRMPEGAAKSWGVGSLSGIQMDLFQCQAFNMLLFALGGVVLLNGVSTETTIGLSSLLCLAELTSYIIADIPAKYALPMAGVYFQIAVFVTMAYANLVKVDWAKDYTINKAFAVWNIIIAVAGLVAPKKIWGDSLDGGQGLTNLALHNWMSSNVGCAAFVCSLVFLDSSPSKVIGYSHVPFAFLSVYNALFSKEAKEVTVDDSVRWFFAAIMSVLVAAALL